MKRKKGLDITIVSNNKHYYVTFNIVFIYRGVIKVIVDEQGIENIRNSKGDSLFRKVIKDKPGN